MIKNTAYLVCCLLLLPSLIRGQTEDSKNRFVVEQGNVITGGPTGDVIIPTDMFGSGFEVTNVEENVRFNIKSLVSFRVGATVRFDLVQFKKMKMGNMFSLTTGIYYNQRRFQLNINDVAPNANDSLLAGGRFNFVSYEIPIIPHLHLQATDRLWLHFGIGVGVEFFPSHIYIPDSFEDKLGENGSWYYYGARKSLVVPNAKVNFGIEYRTPKAGYLSLGFTFQRPFPNVMTGYAEYWSTRNGDTYAIYPYGSKDHGNDGMKIIGQFFSIGASYYIPPSKGLKDATPDWIKERQKEARKKRRERLLRTP